MMDLIKKAYRAARDPEYTAAVAASLLLVDTVLTAGIIWKVPCRTFAPAFKTIANMKIDTEIDWKAYMQQIALYIAGERNYAKIHGDTGPLVYPGGHVYIYRSLYELTTGGDNILLAQYVFAVLYLVTLYTVMRVYQEAKVPPYIIPLLILSKRLHSIFVLRLFNDGFAVLFFFVSILFYQQRRWTYGAVAWSIGLGIKMSLLLALPAVGVITWQAVGRDRSLKQVSLMVSVQAMLGYEFLGHEFWSYLSRAFQLDRQFLYQWTVNWRFIEEETFLSKGFSQALLASHAAVTLAFIGTRWIRPSGLSLTGIETAILDPPPAKEQEIISRRMKPDFVAFTMLSSMLIGCLFARSLHYQFFVYIAWSTPFLLWRSGLHPVMIYAIWAAQEWAWNINPSTDISSMVVVGSLALTLVASWIGTRSAWLNSAPSETSKAG